MALNTQETREAARERKMIEEDRRVLWIEKATEKGFTRDQAILIWEWFAKRDHTHRPLLT